jgi:quercetin dioxygenase-like cupin family protein
MEPNTVPGTSLYLGGKVRKEVLPVFETLPADGGPRLKRLLLPQGELAQLLDGDQPMRYLAFVELREGTIRGNHFHKVKEEFIYVLAGRVRVVVEDTDDKARATVDLKPGELLFISTEVAHRVDALQMGQAVEFSESRFDGSDTYRYIITEESTLSSANAR